VHIFWQKRICAAAPGAETPWWYPCKTEGGALRADRLVWPIPPGVHWRDVRPPEGTERKTLEVRSTKLEAKTKPEARKVKANGPGPGQVGILVGGKIKYVPKPGYVSPTSPTSPAAALSVPLLPAPVKAKRARAPKEKVDPAVVATVRELRDRCLEHANGSGAGTLIPIGKYEVLKGPPGSGAGAASALPGPGRPRRRLRMAV
jgi:hypothetical protein